MEARGRSSRRDLAIHRIAAAVGLAMLPAVGHGQDKWDAHIDLEAKPGSRRSLGEADLFLPLAQDARMLVFGNLRLRMDDHSGREGNLGLGVRRMTEGGFNLGGYVYVDRRRTETGNRFSQVTLGGEALGRDWDLRGNAYLPVGTKGRDLGPTGPSSASLAGNTIIVTTLAREERALKGFDAEVGYRIPLWPADADRQLRLYVGGYRFSDVGVRVSGPRVRAELALHDLPAFGRGAQLLLGAEYQDDNARGGQGFASVRLRVPLGGGREAGRGAISFQERRMTAPVVRDVDIVTRTVDAPWRPALVEAVSVTADGRAFTVVSSDTTPGDGLAAALAAAGPDSTVLLSGVFSTSATTPLQSGQTLLAGNIGLRTPSGRTAVLNSPATIAASSSVGPSLVAVTPAANSTINGLTITSTGSAGLGTAGVRVDGVSGVTIVNSTIRASELGTNSSNGVVITNGGSATIVGNRISAVGNNNAGVATAINVFDGGPVTVANNVLSGSGSTIANFNRFLGMRNGVTINTGASTGNTATSGVCVNLGAIGSVGFTDGSTCP